MANREHDGSEHAGTRAWDRGHDPDADRDPRPGGRPGDPEEAPDESGAGRAPADAQWFGDASPPPPPYAIDEAPPPPYAVGGMGAYEAEQPYPRQPQYPQPPQQPAQPLHPQQGPEHPGGAAPEQPPAPGLPHGDPYGAPGPGAPPGPQGPQPQGPPQPSDPYRPAAGHQPSPPPGVPGWPQPRQGESGPRPPEPEQYPADPYRPGPHPAEPYQHDPYQQGPYQHDPYQRPPQSGYPSGPYPSPVEDPGPQQPYAPEPGYPAPGPQQDPPPGADRPAPPVAYNGQPMRSGPVRPADAPGPLPPPPPGGPHVAEPPQGYGWAPPGASGPAQPDAPGAPGGPGPGEFVPEDDAPLWNRSEQPGDPAQYGASDAPGDAGGPAPDAPDPAGNGTGRVPTGGLTGGFAQWAPPERAPSPTADAPEGGGRGEPGDPGAPADGEPRPGERTEVIEPYRDFGDPASGAGAQAPDAGADSAAPYGQDDAGAGRPPHAWPPFTGQEPGGEGAQPGWDQAPDFAGDPADPAAPPRSSGLGRAPYDTGPQQWTSAEPAAPYGHGEDEPPAPLVGDGPAGPSGMHPHEPYGPRSPEIPDPEQLPPLPPNASRPGGAPGPWQGDVPPPPGAGTRQDGPPSGPVESGGGWAWSPPGEGGAPREAWAPPQPGDPGFGADTGGRPAARPPYGEWAPESAPSGPQAWNAMPPPAPEGPPPQQPPHGPQPGGGYPSGYDPAYDPYDPYRQPGYGPSGTPAPPPGQPGQPVQPGRPGGYPQAPGAGGPGYPGQPPSGPQTGFQYPAHFAEGVQPAQQPGQAAHPETAEDLRAENLVSDKRPGPAKGWRKMLHSATFGLVDVGESAAEQRRRELAERARTHVGGGHHRVAVLSLKGGVGKTTTTVALGSMLASLRGDRVLAVDANPDRGTLSDKVRLETAATIRDLLNEKEAISRYADIRGFTSQAGSRLEILASDRDPAVSEAFSEDDYREVSWLLEHYYSICLTDCGTGLLHSAMRGVLGLADQVVLVSSASVDGARSASATLDWLEAHQYGPLVRGAVVVLSMVRAGKSSVDLDRLEQHFASRCRAVVRVPWDSHLEEGAEVDLERLAPATRDAYLQLAATVGEAFAWPR